MTNLIVTTESKLCDLTSVTPGHSALFHMVTHRDFFAQTDLRQHFLDALSAAHLPDGGLRRLVGDRPIPRLQLVPNSAESATSVLSVTG